MNLTAHIETYHLHSVNLDGNSSQALQARISIVIYDAETAQPANGNNCRVIYNLIDEYGNINSRVETVPGMRLVIYEGEVGRIIFNHDHELVSSTSKRFEIISVIPGENDSPSLPPPIQTSDIRISNVDTQSESAPGAADGQLTVDAYSNYLPLAYQLNGTLTPASPVFTGLAGGTYTVTIFDAAGFSATRDVFIPTVNGLLQSDPSVTLPGGNISRWNAAFNPVVLPITVKITR